jgi:hypothetical protein
MNNMQIIRDVSGTTTVCLSYDIESPFARAYFLQHPECTKIEMLTGFFMRDGILYGEVDRENQRIQFARIIWEMNAACQDQGMLDDMAESMDLSVDELNGLVDVAVEVFEKAKEQLTGVVLSP